MSTAYGKPFCGVRKALADDAADVRTVSVKKFDVFFLIFHLF